VFIASDTGGATVAIGHQPLRNTAAAAAAAASFAVVQSPPGRSYRHGPAGAQTEA